jgi:hypothetical protein
VIFDPSNPDTYRVRTIPFRHAIIAPVLTSAYELALLDEMGRIPWDARSASFYRFQSPIEGRNGCGKIIPLFRDGLRIDEWLPWLEEAFGCRLGANVLYEVQKYNVGDGIGSHTDFRAAEVRCVLNLNSGWSSEDGGVWILAGESSLQKDPTYLPPLSNTAYVFSTSEKSFHALSRRKRSVGYGLVIRIPRKDA